jgi:hypothetical protein
MNISGNIINQNVGSVPAIMVESIGSKSIAAFWAAIVPAIPDLISVECSRTGMTYENALQSLLQIQKSWIQKLHGESRFSLSLRCISSGDSSRDLVLGIVGRTEGEIEAETITSARNFFNKIRDTFPINNPLEHCQKLEDLAYLRLPFLPVITVSWANFAVK